MPAFANPLINDFTNVGGVNRAQAAADLNQLVPISLDGQNPQDFTAGTALNLIYAGKLWKYDSTDVTSVHDGITVIVTSDSKRFKCLNTTDQSRGVWKVVAFQNAPPASPATGAAYGVGAAPSGAWASNGNYIAVALVGGGSPIWGYAPPTAGLIAFDVSQLIFRSYTGAAWIDGIGVLNAAASIAPEALIVPRFTVQAQQAAPPGSPSANQYWIVAPSATGAWVGQDQKIAKCTNATGPVWAFYSAAEGWKAWNVATAHEMVFSSSAWADQQRARIVGYPALLVRTSTMANTGASTDYTTAPTTASGLVVFPDGGSNVPAYTLAKATNRLLIRLRFETTTAATVTVAVYKDGQATCSVGNWRNFTAVNPGTIETEIEVAPGDTSSHTWNVRLSGSACVRAELQFIEIET